MNRDVDFFKATSGNLFYTLTESSEAEFSPVSDIAIFIPPFAEELNRSRSLLSRISMCLAESGYATILVDLFGTGDSEGEFKDTDWDVWRDNILVTYHELLTMGYSNIHLIGLRLGCLLSSTLDFSELDRIKSINFLEPQISGSTTLTNILRYGVSSGWSGRKKEYTLEILREQLENNTSVEIGGYEINAKLANSIEQSSLFNLKPTLGMLLNVIELKHNVQRESAKDLSEFIQAMNTEGLNVSLSQVCCNKFWQLDECYVPDNVVSNIADSIKFNECD